MAKAQNRENYFKEILKEFSQRVKLKVFNQLLRFRLNFSLIINDSFVFDKVNIFIRKKLKQFFSMKLESEKPQQKTIMLSLLILTQIKLIMNA